MEAILFNRSITRRFVVLLVFVIALSVQSEFVFDNQKFDIYSSTIPDCFLPLYEGNTVGKRIKFPGLERRKKQSTLMIGKNSFQKELSGLYGSFEGRGMLPGFYISDISFMSESMSPNDGYYSEGNNKSAGGTAALFLESSGKGGALILGDYSRTFRQFEYGRVDNSILTVNPSFGFKLRKFSYVRLSYDYNRIRDGRSGQELLFLNTNAGYLWRKPDSSYSLLLNFGCDFIDKIRQRSLDRIMGEMLIGRKVTIEQFEFYYGISSLFEKRISSDRNKNYDIGWLMNRDFDIVRLSKISAPCLVKYRYSEKLDVRLMWEPYFVVKKSNYQDHIVKKREAHLITSYLSFQWKPTERVQINATPGMQDGKVSSAVELEIGW